MSANAIQATRDQNEIIAQQRIVDKLEDQVMSLRCKVEYEQQNMLSRAHWGFRADEFNLTHYRERELSSYELDLKTQKAVLNRLHANAEEKNCLLQNNRN